MSYRISLHLLATVWHCLLLSWAFSRRRKDRSYAALVPIYVISAMFTASWAAGLIFESLLAIRLTWIGALWPVAMLVFVDALFGVSREKWTKRGLWTLAVVTMLAGLTPFCIEGVITFEPEFAANCGPVEPFLRISLGFQIVLVLWTSVQLFLRSHQRRPAHEKYALIGMQIYSAGALLTSALLPLFGNYRFLEPTSYGSVIWSTFTVWCAFKGLEFRNQSLTELDNLKKNLINHVTHEFRTPLNAISSAIEIISGIKSVDSPMFKDYTSMLSANTGRLSHFVDELLDIATIQQTKVELNRRECDAYELAHKVVRDLTPIAAKENVAIQLVGQATPVECDPQKIEQVLTNLVSNAIKAAPAGKISISVRTYHSHAEISVTDDGVGIAAEHLSHVFSSFYHVTTSKFAHKGAGLGLAIARGWVEAHGGNIRAESLGLGRGTTMKFSIPRR